jgi:MFS family permease
MMNQSNQAGAVPRGALLILRPVHPVRPCLIGIVYAAVLLPLTIVPKVSGNVLSRDMTIEAIVERGTLTIDRSPLRARSGSPDVVKFGRHFYSDKPPVLAALAAPLYALLFGMGIRFSGPPAQFVVANLVLTWVLVGLSSALTLVALRMIIQTAPVSLWVADLLVLGFGFGSLLLVYGVTFNNHSVAAALVTWSLALVLLEKPTPGPKGNRFRRLDVGLLAGLAATIDLPAGGVLLVGLGVWLTLRDRTIPLMYLAGVVPPLLFHAVLQSRITGSPWPAEMYPEAFQYPGSYWATAAGVWKETVPRWQFGLELLFGPQGWLTVTPILVFGAVGLGSVLIRPRDPFGPLAWTVGGILVVLLVYYIWGVRRTDYAGQSFGVRHLLAVTPACFAFAVVALGRARGPIAPVLFALLMMVGVAYALVGWSDPWKRIESRERVSPTLQVLQRFVVYPWSSYAR